jgi:hypothetical protein
VARSVVLHLGEAHPRVYLEELIDIIQDNSVVFIRVHLPLFLLLKRSWSFASKNNRTIKHLGRSLRVFVYKQSQLYLSLPLVLSVTYSWV